MRGGLRLGAWAGFLLLVAGAARADESAPAGREVATPVAAAANPAAPDVATATAAPAAGVVTAAPPDAAPSTPAVAEIRPEPEPAGVSALELVGETVESGTNFIFRQYRLAPLAQYSYLIGSQGEAMLVDPAREAGRYLADCRELGLTLRCVVLTHAHSDFVAGHSELRHAVAGVEFIMGEAAGARFAHRPVRHGDELPVGGVKVVVLATPGHALDGISLAVHAPASAPEPRLALTGDALLVGAVGRPDLLEDAPPAAVLAAMGFRAWTDRLAPLPDAVRVFPGHGGGGMFQGRELSPRPVTTLGAERAANPWLQHRDGVSYVAAILDGLAEPPSYFRHVVRINLDGPALVMRNEALPPELAAAETEALARKDVWLADVRPPEAFAAGHARGSVHVALDDRFEARLGSVIPWGEPFILTGSDAEVAEARHRLHRIGYDVPTGYLAGGLESWVQAGLPVETLTVVAPADLAGRAGAGAAGALVLDTRRPEERAGARLAGAVAMPVAQLAAARRRLDPGMPLLVLGASFQDASLAGSLLQRLGFAEVRILAGTAPASAPAPAPVARAAVAEPPVPPPAAPAAAAPAPASAEGSHPAAVPASVQPPAAAGAPEGWPEPMTPEDLARRLLDWPGSVELVDLRPAWQYAEFHVPDSVNMSVAQALAVPWPSTEARPLVLICRDGYLSAAVAGALSRHASRPVRYLVGGVKRYYDDVVKPQAGRRAGTPAAPGPDPRPATP